MKSIIRFRRSGFCLVLAAFVIGIFLSFSNSAVFAADKAKYVFMMIGDGMALTQRNAAEIYLAASKGESLKPGIVKLNMSKLPVQGMCTTYSSNSIITDSAAAGTALSTGHKTKSGVVGMDAGGNESFPLISEMAKAAGMKVGIISTVDIDHATPACYYAHQPTRNNYYEISLELANSGFDYFAGGDVKKPTGSKKDKPSSIKVIEEAGYKRVSDRASFLALKAGDGKVMAVNPVLDRSKAMPYYMDRTDKEITVAEFTRKGIELLDNPKGFFMMVEGGKIDWACHANDAVASIMNTIAFDEAVGVAMEFYNKHPEETLIVVTGDHETGGMTIGFAGTKYDTFFDKLSNQKVSYEAFDKVLAEFKKNSGAKFEDVLPLINEHFGLKVYSSEKMKSLEEKAKAGDSVAKAALGMGLKDFEVDQLRASFAQSMVGKKERARDDETYLLYGGYEPLTVNITHILNQKAGLAWTSYSHTGVPVPVSAIGAGADLFGGYYDNTDIFFKTLQAMGIEGQKVASR
jgi:alkaline phosphatase